MVAVITSSSGKVSVISLTKMALVLVIFFAALMTGAEENLAAHECVMRRFSSIPLPPLPSDRVARRIAWYKRRMCRDLGRVELRYRMAHYKPSPDFMAALKKVDVFKNNDTALNEYLREKALLGNKEDYYNSPEGLGASYLVRRSVSKEIMHD